MGRRLFQDYLQPRNKIRDSYSFVWCRWPATTHNSPCRGTVTQPCSRVPMSNEDQTIRNPARRPLVRGSPRKKETASRLARESRCEGVRATEKRNTPSGIRRVKGETGTVGVAEESSSFGPFNNCRVSILRLYTEYRDKWVGWCNARIFGINYRGKM